MWKRSQGPRTTGTGSAPPRDQDRSARIEASTGCQISDLGVGHAVVAPVPSWATPSVPARFPQHRHRRDRIGGQRPGRHQRVTAPNTGGGLTDLAHPRGPLRGRRRTP